MANPSITRPANINADVVLELGSHQSAQQLRRLQAKLTTTAREIQGLITGGYSARAHRRNVERRSDSASA
jgi:hypothetical protein